MSEQTHLSGQSWGDKPLIPGNLRRAIREFPADRQLPSRHSSQHKLPLETPAYINPSRDRLTGIGSQRSIRPRPHVIRTQSSARNLSSPETQPPDEALLIPHIRSISGTVELRTQLAPVLRWCGDRVFLASKGQVNENSILGPRLIDIQKVAEVGPIIPLDTNYNEALRMPDLPQEKTKILSSAQELVVSSKSGDAEVQEVGPDDRLGTDDPNTPHRLQGVVDIKAKSSAPDLDYWEEKTEDSGHLVIVDLPAAEAPAMGERSQEIIPNSPDEPLEQDSASSTQSSSTTTTAVPTIKVTKPVSRPNEYIIPGVFDPFKYGRPGEVSSQIASKGDGGGYEGRAIYGARPGFAATMVAPEPRTITINGLPSQPTLAMVSTICKGAGPVETITLFETLKKARVSFVNSADARLFFEKSGNGADLVYKTSDGESTTHTVLVQMKPDINFLSSATRYLVKNKKATRTVLIVGWDRESVEYLVDSEKKHKTYEQLLIELAKTYSYTSLDSRVEGARWRKNEGVLEGLLIYARIKDAYCALAAMLLEDELQGCKISYGKDPCAP